MNNVLIVGGTNGIGLAIAQELLKLKVNHIFLFGKEQPNIEDIDDNLKDLFLKKTKIGIINLADEDYSVFDNFNNIDTLIITAGFGRVAPFESLTEIEIKNLIKVNQLSAIQIIKKYYDKINSDNNFYCAVMGSIAGHVASPLFSVYGASKFGLCSFIENINTELEMNGKINRILDVSPGSIKGTNFNGEKNNINLTAPLARDIINKMLNRERLFIPDYNETFKGVINRYKQDPEKYSRESYRYKQDNARLSYKPQIIVGYLSGTFDLFHVGHLNLLKRAKEKCDYLIVGVHKSGAWKNKETFIPFEDRVAILKSIKYVDKVVESCTEDSEAWKLYKYNKLFVGSDYKNTERFLRYEKYFKDKGVEIIYFPYTQKISSTKLRENIKKSEE